MIIETILFFNSLQFAPWYKHPYLIMGNTQSNTQPLLTNDPLHQEEPSWRVTGAGGTPTANCNGIENTVGSCWLNTGLQFISAIDESHEHENSILFNSPLVNDKPMSLEDLMKFSNELCTMREKNNIISGHAVDFIIPAIIKINYMYNNCIGILCSTSLLWFITSHNIAIKNSELNDIMNKKYIFISVMSDRYDEQLFLFDNHKLVTAHDYVPIAISFGHRDDKDKSNSHATCLKICNDSYHYIDDLRVVELDSIDFDKLYYGHADFFDKEFTKNYIFDILYAKIDKDTVVIDNQIKLSWALGYIMILEYFVELEQGIDEIMFYKKFGYTLKDLRDMYNENKITNYLYNNIYQLFMNFIVEINAEYPNLISINNNNGNDIIIFEKPNEIKNLPGYTPAIVIQKNTIVKSAIVLKIGYLVNGKVYTKPRDDPIDAEHTVEIVVFVKNSKMPNKKHKIIKDPSTRIVDFQYNGEADTNVSVEFTNDNVEIIARTQFVDIKKINAKNKQIKQFTNNKFKNCDTIDLSNNLIGIIPDINVNKLFMRNCKFNPLEKLKISYIKYLDLSNSIFETLPTIIESSSLKFLILDSTQPNYKCETTFNCDLVLLSMKNFNPKYGMARKYTFKSIKKIDLLNSKISYLEIYYYGDKPYININNEFDKKCIKITALTTYKPPVINSLKIHDSIDKIIENAEYTIQQLDNEIITITQTFPKDNDKIVLLKNKRKEYLNYLTQQKTIRDAQLEQVGIQNAQIKMIEDEHRRKELIKQEEQMRIIERQRAIQDEKRKKEEAERKAQATALLREAEEKKRIKEQERINHEKELARQAKELQIIEERKQYEAELARQQKEEYDKKKKEELAKEQLRLQELIKQEKIKEESRLREEAIQKIEAERIRLMEIKKIKDYQEKIAEEKKIKKEKDEYDAWVLKNELEKQKREDEERQRQFNLKQEKINAEFKKKQQEAEQQAKINRELIRTSFINSQANQIFIEIDKNYKLIEQQKEAEKRKLIAAEIEKENERLRKQQEKEELKRQRLLHQAEERKKEQMRLAEERQKRESSYAEARLIRQKEIAEEARVAEEKKKKELQLAEEKKKKRQEEHDHAQRIAQEKAAQAQAQHQQAQKQQKIVCPAV